jgi:hypothetical protein
MTAPIRTDYVTSALDFDADEFTRASAGVVMLDEGQLWTRLAEGNMVWDRTSPWVHIRAALQRTARTHVRGKATPDE